MAEPLPMKRAKTVAAEAEVEPRQVLPDDLVLEIVARCPTVADVIRCAAASKPIRRRILDAPFLRRLRGFLAPNGDGRAPPVRKLLVGLYHQIDDPRRQPAFVPASDGAGLLPPSVAALPPAPDRDAAGGGVASEFGPYLPVASRRSLLVLRRRCRNRDEDHRVERRHGLYSVELSVCNPTTGERRVLPPHDVFDMSHALLDVDPTTAPPSSFKLLVANLTEDDPSTLYVQVFSSEGGGRGPPLACPMTSSRGDVEDLCEFTCAGDGRPRPVVLGDSVHWLCATESGDRVLSWRWRGGKAREAASIEKLPRGYKFGRPDKCLAVLPSAGDAAGPEALLSLSLIVLERGEIEVWAREKGGAGSTREWEWKLRRRIREATIPRPANLCEGWMSGAELSWFCEGSGTLFLCASDETMSRSLLLDLESMEVSKLENSKWEPKAGFCPYEVDMLSYMRFRMKRF